MVSSLKKEILELLEKDIEFRYAIAGYLGLTEILKKLDALAEGQNKLWENQNRLWEEIKSLREGQNKLWEEVKALREGQNKLWEEVKSLREGQNRLWENQNKLWESQQKLWEEVKALREGQNKLWRNFRELGRAVGMTLDHYTAAFLEEYLEREGYPEEKVHISVNTKFMINGREIEVDIFNRDPLIVGEVTTYIRDENEAKNEVEKLLKKKEAIESIYKRRADMVILAVANIEPHTSNLLKEMAKRENIKLILGREIKEYI
ncbi:MAG: hypothetical protein ACP5GU_01665 [Thermoprotei archaeon]|jgi:uncharacterized phage infection (PIP) family protein YhgE